MGGGAFKVCMSGGVVLKIVETVSNALHHTLFQISVLTTSHALLIRHLSETL